MLPYFTRLLLQFIAY